MMKIKQTILAFTLLLGFGVFFVTPVASAAKCGGVDLKPGQSCCGGAVTSIISCDETGGDDTKQSGIWGVLILVLTILTAGVGVAGLGGILYGAIIYTTAGGSVDKVKQARGIIANTVIGLIAYALMYSFLNFIIPGGLFNP